MATTTGSRTRRPRVVHFTHHSCGAVGIDWGHTARGALGLLFSDNYCRRYPSTRHPERGCIRARQPGAGLWDPWSIPSTTDPERVTCATCRRELGRPRSVSAYEEPPASDALITKRVWLVCCRHRGMPWPFDTASLAEIEADDRARGARDFGRAFALSGLLACAVVDPDGARNDLAEIVSSLGDLSDRARPAIDEITMALDLLAEVSTMRARAEQYLRGISDAIRDGAAPLPTGMREAHSQMLNSERAATRNSVRLNLDYRAATTPPSRSATP